MGHSAVTFTERSFVDTKLHAHLNMSDTFKKQKSGYPCGYFAAYLMHMAEGEQKLQRVVSSKISQLKFEHFRIDLFVRSVRYIPAQKG